jgi:glycosyltransferase involved in cell wall biosynthesis
MSRVPLTAVVLTFNEEKNLGACLESLAGWVEQIFVVDSGSTDRTADIARACGADVVSHPFESHATQWQWALASLPFRTEWVLGLDADQRVTPELRQSVAAALAGPDPGMAGYFLNRRQIFRGTWIRHGGYYPKYLLKLFRRSAVSIDARDLVDHHFAVHGPVARLAGDLIEDNQNEATIAEWIAKHNRYAQLQARDELSRAGDRSARGGSALGTPDDRVRLRKRVWARLPLFVRPFGYFVYRYVFRLGFLDGKQGFIFHFMQALWYRLLVDINRDELAARTRGASVDAKSALDTRRVS